MSETGVRNKYALGPRDLAKLAVGMCGIGVLAAIAIPNLLMHG